MSHHGAELESVKLTDGADNAPPVNDWPTIVKNDKEADHDEDWKEHKD
jgi:hypothetical protein